MIGELTAIKTALGPELWLMVLAFASGAVARLAKRWAPKPFVPYVSVASGAILSATWAAAASESVGPAAVLGLVAGGMAVGGHELTKKTLERFVGSAVAERALGVAAEKKVEPAAEKVD